uniref:Transcriptional regulator n=1 Tax=Strongyloides venezuelensis TaxID=75913 RepID=A0A0K0FWF6_STRVS
MPSREEKLKCVLSAANALGFNISQNVTLGKQLSVINLLERGYSDTPEELAKNIESIVSNIKRILKTTTVWLRSPKISKQLERMQFKDAMEFAADNENGESTHPVSEKKQIMILKSKLSKKLMERLRTEDQG